MTLVLLKETIVSDHDIYLPLEMVTDNGVYKYPETRSNNFYYQEFWNKRTSDNIHL